MRFPICASAYRGWLPILVLLPVGCGGGAWDGATNLLQEGFYLGPATVDTALVFDRVAEGYDAS